MFQLTAEAIFMAEGVFPRRILPGQKFDPQLSKIKNMLPGQNFRIPRQVQQFLGVRDQYTSNL